MNTFYDFVVVRNVIKYEIRKINKYDKLIKSYIIIGSLHLCKVRIGTDQKSFQVAVELMTAP